MDGYNAIYGTSDIGRMAYSGKIVLDPTVVLIVLVILLAVYLVMSWIMGRIFKKAGEESWKAFVPVYNSWVFLELGGQKGFWVLLSFIPIVQLVVFVFMVMAAITIGRNFGKSDMFALLYFFLPPIWALILAFGGSTWQGAEPASPYGRAPRAPVAPPPVPHASGAVPPPPATPPRGTQPVAPPTPPQPPRKIQ